MMKGALDFLLSDSPLAEALRGAFVFKVVPMLNPDGVICGNYRCSLAGLDLNRVWQGPAEAVQPTILGLKSMMRSFQQERPVSEPGAFGGGVVTVSCVIVFLLVFWIRWPFSLGRIRWRWLMLLFLCCNLGRWRCRCG